MNKIYCFSTKKKKICFAFCLFVRVFLRFDSRETLARTRVSNFIFILFLVCGEQMATTLPTMTSKFIYIFFSFHFIQFIPFMFSFSFTFFFTVELLSSWESLLHWSENESVAKQLQTEMAVLVGKLHKIGTSCANLDTESAIHLAIEEAQVRVIVIEREERNKRILF